MGLDKRKMMILTAVVDEYIKTGEPVGSKAVLNKLDINISSATIRNDMSYLERLGFLEQPHTSAGRIPTFMCYRFYIDHLMCPQPLTNEERERIDGLISQNQLQTVDAVIDTAVNVLSELTNLAVVSKTNKLSFSIITRVEVIPAGKRLYALLIITSSGTVMNKVCRIEFDLTNEQLDFFENFVNQNLSGMNIELLTPQMMQNLALALGTYMMSLSPLLHAVYELGEEIAKAGVDLKGEQRLYSAEDMRPDDVVAFLAHKNELDKLLSSAFDGISVVFGEEEESFAVSNSSLIMSPYKLNGNKVGSFGVIGPVRLDYAKIIPHIEYISDSVTEMISKIISNNQDRRDKLDG